MSKNNLIIANLQILFKEAQQSREPKDRFRANAYRKAIKAIQGCQWPIESRDDARKLTGVGDKIADKIQEILNTGKLHQVEELGTETLNKTKCIAEFGNIWGIGPVKAKNLWDAGARSIDDIREYYTHILNENQLVGLKYYQDFLKRIKREEVDWIAQKISREVLNIQKELNWSVEMRVCGSYRRQSDTCGDMDILLSEHCGHPILDELVSRLCRKKILFETLGLGKTKFMGITKTRTGNAFRIDIETIPPVEWPFALLYFTGSGQFNERQRTIAKKMGYSLSEHGLKNNQTGEYVQGIKSERNIFEFLEMEYLAPWERIS